MFPEAVQKLVFVGKIEISYPSRNVKILHNNQPHLSLFLVSTININGTDFRSWRLLQTVSFLNQYPLLWFQWWHAKKLARSKTKQTNPTPVINKELDNATSNKPNSTNTPCPSSLDHSQEITFNGAFDDVNIKTNEQSKLVTDFKRIMARFYHGDVEMEGVKEIKKTLDNLGPMNDIVYLYVRFACQLPTSNFNTDSLCSLLCISKQCNFKPYIFLSKVKSLEICNNHCKYGVLFSFVTQNSKDVDGVHLETKFLGLSTPSSVSKKM